MLLLISLALAVPPKDLTAPYCAAPKALYAWNCATGHTRDGESTWWHLLHDTNGCGGPLVDFATAHRFQRVYLYIGAMEWDWGGSFSKGVLPDEDALAGLTTRLRTSGVEPWGLWYLNDDPDDLDGGDRVPDLVASVAAFNSRHPEGALAGLHGDQEPNDNAVYDDYLAMNTLGRDEAGGVDLMWGASLKPGWLSIPRGDPLLPYVLPTLQGAR